MDDDEALKMIFDKNRGLISNKSSHASYSFISSWANHYLSWMKNKLFRRHLIKYEDLLENKYETFRDLIVFTNTLMKITEGVNKSKLQRAIESTSFNTLKNKEIKENLNRSSIGFNKWRDFHKENKNLFFNLGPENKWEKMLDPKVKKKIEVNFLDEMKDLKYL